MAPRIRPVIPKKSVSSMPAVEDLTLQILGFLASDQRRLERFFDLTGLGPRTLRRAAEGPHFSTSLFEYLCGDEELLRAFAQQFGYDPVRLEAVRQALASKGQDAC